MMEAKEWMLEQDEIRAHDLYEKDYDELTDEQRETVCRQVEREWVDFYSGWCDYQYELEKDRRIHEQRSAGTTSD